MGLPFLIAQFGIEGFYQLWTFQQMVCNNQEPKEKKKSVTGATKTTSTFTPNDAGFVQIFTCRWLCDMLLALFANKYKLSQNNCSLFCSTFLNTAMAISHQFSTLLLKCLKLVRVFCQLYKRHTTIQIIKHSLNCSCISAKGQSSSLKTIMLLIMTLFLSPPSRQKSAQIIYLLEKF